MVDAPGPVATPQPDPQVQPVPAKAGKEAALYDALIIFGIGALGSLVANVGVVPEQWRPLAAVALTAAFAGLTKLALSRGIKLQKGES